MKASEYSISTEKRLISPAEVAALYIELGWGTEKEYTKARVKRSLENCDMVVFARNGAGELIGIARVLTDGALETKILDLIIAPEYQRQGVGRKIMQKIEQLSKSAAIYCETERKNFPFVEKLGYKRRKGLVVFVKKSKK